jgi:hypothetical protein
MNRNPFKVMMALAAGAYFLWCAYEPSRWHLIDGVDLLIHEGGHIIFSPFGEFLMIAGGSLWQVIMPALFVAYFYYHERPYSAALTLFWVGQSILNVSVYAADSLALQLPLIGGEDSLHDWNYMLERLGLLGQTAKIGGLLRLCGTLVIVAAIFFGLKFSVDGGETDSPVQEAAR